MKRVAALFLLLLLVLCACSKAPETMRGFAMDTEYSIALYKGDCAADIIAATSALENEISWSVATSAVSRLNSGESIKSETLAEIINKCAPLFEKTSGEFSLLMRPLCALWNVGAENPKLPDKSEIEALLPLCRKQITLSGSLIKLEQGAALDLGAVGKGYACDRAIEIMQAADAVGVVSFGGSVAVWGKKPDGAAWKVDISDGSAGKKIGTLTLKSGESVSTSGDSQRYFEIDSKRYHHIISASSGYPAQTDIELVSVISSSGLLSDALSTACFLIGFEKSQALLSQYGEYGAGAVFKLKNGEVKAVGLAADRFEVAK